MKATSGNATLWEGPFKAVQYRFLKVTHARVWFEIADQRLELIHDLVVESLKQKSEMIKAKALTNKGSINMIQGLIKIIQGSIKIIQGEIKMIK